MRHRRRIVVIVAAIAVTLAACGSSSKGASTGGGAVSTSSTTPHVESTVLGTGVTASTIKVGISLTDFTCIQQFVDSIRVNQQQTYQAYIDNINATGGINGRKILPVFKTFCPLTSTSDLNVQICTAFADDDKVFAVLGNLTDAAQDGSVETCLAKKHNTVVISYVLTQTIMSLSPPGMIIYPGTTPERTDTVLFELLKKQGTLRGKKVAVLASASSEPAVKSVVLPDLKKMGVSTGTAAYLTISGADTTAAQAQLASFIERWKSEGVNALFVTGVDVASQQFMEKVRQGMPGITLMTDVGDTLGFGKQEQHAGVRPNPYAGLLTTGGISPHDYDRSANWRYCAAIYQKYTPQGRARRRDGRAGTGRQDPRHQRQHQRRLPEPVAVPRHRNQGRQIPQHDQLGEHRQQLRPDREPRWRTLRLATQSKYDFDDTFTLQSFDPTIPPTGNWKDLTPYQNIAG